ncbi:MAG TPA: arsenate reductase [Phycisphaerales bacterium]|nr:arsenate reductase [Phycisphaerales bacterium]HCD32214.1 arsenate reductase [Phycisphaerales bacterium]
MSQRLKVLFLCTGNSCRSQMAEGWTRHLMSEHIDAYSAGIETHGLNPNAVSVMAELGVDISSQKSQNISEFQDMDLDFVITVCGHAHETCPIFPYKATVLHHGFDDPPKMAKEYSDIQSQLACYRKVRDQIRDFVLMLPQYLQEHAS